MNRREINVRTGKEIEVKLTPVEIAALPTEAELLKTAKKKRRAYLRGAYRHVISGGFDAVAGGVTYRYDSDDDSRGLMTGTVLDISIGWEPPVGWFWACWDKTTNERVEPATTGDELKAIYHAGAVHVETAWQTKNSLSKQVSASSTIGEVAAIIWPWPGGIDPRGALK